MWHQSNQNYSVLDNGENVDMQTVTPSFHLTSVSRAGINVNAYPAYHNYSGFELTVVLFQLVNSAAPLDVEVREAFDWYIYPVVNVDGYEYTWTNVSTHGLL